MTKIQSAMKENQIDKGLEIKMKLLTKINSTYKSGLMAKMTKKVEEEKKDPAEEVKNDEQ